MSASPLAFHRASVAYTETCKRLPDQDGLRAALEAAMRETDVDGRLLYAPGDVLRHDGKVAVVRYVRGEPNAAIFLDGLSREAGTDAYIGGDAQNRARRDWGAPIGHMRVQGALKLARRSKDREALTWRWVTEIQKLAGFVLGRR